MSSSNTTISRCLYLVLIATTTITLLPTAGSSTIHSTITENQRQLYQHTLDVARRQNDGVKDADNSVERQSNTMIRRRAQNDSSTASTTSSSSSSGTSNRKDLSKQQQSILTKLYSQTNGPYWTKSTNWLSSKVSECDWYGIKCNTSGEITSITLEDNKLYGTTPEELFDLTTLLSIDFRQNPIDVKFDNIGNASQLHTLIVSDASVWKLTGIGAAASSLKYLHLTNNDLEGSMPEELFNLIHLEELYLSYNQFTGPLPTQVGQLTKLSELYIVNNQLSGELPSELGKCEHLTELALGENKFTGTIPTEVLTRLEDLRLLSLQQDVSSEDDDDGGDDDYGLSGPLPDLSGLKQLKDVYLGGNHFTGTIPETFMNGNEVAASSTNGVQPKITVELIDNLLTGTVPSSLATRFANVRFNLYLRGNHLMSLSDSLCNQKNWNNGDVGQFGCDGILCPVGTYSTLGRRSADNELVQTCFSCDDVGYEAPYMGSTACTLSQVKTLQHFYQRTGGTDGLWFNDDNWNNMEEWSSSKNSTITVCDLYGITCEHELDEDGLTTKPTSNEKAKIVSIDLSNNGLTGRFPHEFFGIQHLREINLSNNANLRMRFKNIESATSLETLTLSNTTVVDMTDLVNATSTLNELRLSNVGLEGSFPSEVFKLTNLTTLYLSYNNFGTTIPTNLGQLSKLQYFYCYSCGLKGSLDGKTFSSLVHLMELSLGQNKLEGTIPKRLFELPKLEFLSLDENPTMGSSSSNGIHLSNIALATKLKELRLSNMGLRTVEGIGQAPALEILHLTDNKLKGPIPNELFQMKTLKQLFLNYNSLSGPLSANIQFLTNLQELFIYDNDLSGQLPHELGLLQNLTTLAIAENRWTGTLPPELNLLSQLRILALQSENNDTLPGIGGPLLAFDNLSQLKELYLGGNSFTGSIPPNFLGNSVYKQTDDIYVDLLDNQLTGIVPASLVNFDSMKLMLKGNRITGIADELCSKGNWMEGEVGLFGCNAILCPQDFTSDIGRQATVATPCVVCDGTNTFAPYMGSTSCQNERGDIMWTERQILEQLYKSTDGTHNWRTTDGWLSQDGTTSDICTWYGVTCQTINGESHVTELSLKKNGLSGIVPSTLFQLNYLTKLDLSRNDVEVSFESIDRASDTLVELLLSDTQVRSFEGLGQATNLTILHLQNNHMDGPLPSEELFSLPKLEQLYLSNNDLTGTLPDDIDQLTNLKIIHLYGNQLKGQLPDTLGSLAQLETLDLAENDFTGTLPSTFNELTKLTKLILHQWTRDHDGIKGPLLDFAKLTQLTELRLDSNTFTGTIPSTFLSGLYGTSNTIEVGLASNRLEGAFPSSLGQISKLNIDVTENMLSALPSDLCSTQTEWNHKEVGKYGCDAIMCPPGTYNTRAGRQSSNQSTCVTCTNNLQGAPYFGSINCGGGNVRSSSTLGANGVPMTEVAILEQFYFRTGGRYWSESEGWLLDSVDKCQWSGITCNDNGSVMSIILDDHKLSGSIPTTLFQLPQLSILSLKNNPLKIKNFAGIDQATRLRVLKLSGTGIRNVDGISMALNLVELHLTDNDLRGAFPTEIYKLNNLQSLFLDYNKLSGTVPDELFQTMGSHLQELYLFNNRFTGQIPNSIGQMTQLRSLVLSENSFTGTLPSELEQLTNLEVVALQQKPQRYDAGTSSSSATSGIGGPLLTFSPLTKLKILYLGPNHLTGTIPRSFLSGIEDTSLEMEIDLSNNYLQGAVPMELQRFTNVELRLQNNELTEIESQLCTQTKWNSGNVGTFGCDGIMCDIHTYNILGRATSEKGSCQPCSEGTSTNGFMGSTECFDQYQTQSLGERAYLEMFYTQLNGPQWRFSDRWNSGTEISICDWHGIKCPEEEEGGSIAEETVEELYLPKNGLEGTVPPGLFDSLPNLKAINLGGNDVTFRFGGIQRASNLQELNLDSTNLSSVIGIEKAPSTLQSLHLRSNLLKGKFPIELTTLTSLTELDVSDNLLTGSLPSELQNLSRNLESFSCFQNRFSGTLPDWLSDFSNLVYLRLGQNDFSGTLPDELETNLIYLEHIDLSNQTHYGGIGLTGTLPTFANQQYLSEIDLSENDFSGMIPSNMLENVDVSYSISIDLRSNRIQGSIPSDLKRFTSLSIYLSDNAISTLDTSLCSSSSSGQTSSTSLLWMRGNVQEFGCDALLCPPQTYNANGYQSSLNTGCQPCPTEQVAPYYGTTKCLATAHGSLRALYLATNGDQWKQKNNWLGGSNSNPCTWFGITCWPQDRSAASVPQIRAIELPSNNLVGSIPLEIFDLLELETLDISNNAISLSFDGDNDETLSTYRRSASKLRVLKMDTTQISSLQGLGRMARGLVELYAQENNFRGTSLPDDDLFNLYRLEVLSLSGSKIGGTLSSRIGDLSSLRKLHLADNDIGGEIPRHLGKCTQLEELILSENDWTGTLPDTFNKLTNLRLLEISSFTRSSGGGGLTGTLPHFSDLSQLNQLNLGGNQLSGTISKKFLYSHQPSSNSTTDSDEVQIILTGNNLEGTLPGTLASRFDNLILDVTDNRLEAINSKLCKQTNWMRGRVGLYGCKALLCPRGTHNAHGRQSNDDMPCVPCEGMKSANFLGSIECTVDEQKDKERQILMKFYNTCGGRNWHKQENWTSTDVDICHWEGLSCSRGTSVDSMLLGANNIVGTPPKELFELPALEWLWLYSNPLSSFTFDGIENAKKLRSLVLDSTGLTSVSGIGRATALVELDLRFNKLKGPVPRDLQFLGDTLESLSLSDNQLTGLMPRWLENFENLRKLRLGSNELSGPLLSFASSSRLLSMDVSDNKLSGPIPSNLLERAADLEDAGQAFFFDFSDNQLTGVVPSSLSRFAQHHVTLLLRNNHFTSIDSDVCQNTEWNDGDVNQFGCDGLMCPVGTYNDLGRLSSDSLGGGNTNSLAGEDGSDNGAECRSCDKNMYMGQAECSSGFSSWRQRSWWFVPMGFLVLLLLGIMTMEAI